MNEVQQCEGSKVRCKFKNRKRELNPKSTWQLCRFQVPNPLSGDRQGQTTNHNPKRKRGNYLQAASPTHRATAKTTRLAPTSYSREGTKAQSIDNKTSVP